MPKITTIEVSVGVKPSSNYQSYHLDLAATAQIEEGEDPIEAIRELRLKLTRTLYEEQNMWITESSTTPSSPAITPPNPTPPYAIAGR